MTKPSDWTKVLDQLSKLDTILEAPEQLSMKVFKELHLLVSEYDQTFPGINHGYDANKKRYIIEWLKYDERFKRNLRVELEIELIILKTQKDNKETISLVITSLASPLKRALATLSGTNELREWVKNLMEEIFVECV